MLRIVRYNKNKDEADSLSFVTIGGIRWVEVIYSNYGTWKLTNFDISSLRENTKTPDNTKVLVMTVEFENGKRAIYITDAYAYLLEQGKTVERYFAR